MKKIPFLYRLMYVCLLSSTLYLCFMRELGIMDSMWSHLVIITGVGLVYSIVEFARGRIYLYFVWGAALVLLGIKCGFDDLLSRLKGPGVELSFTEELILLAVYVLLCYLVENAMEKSKGLKVLLAVGAALLLFFYMWKNWYIPHSGVVCAIVYILMVVAEQIWSKWQRHSKGDIKGYMVWLSPFWAGFLVLMLLIPARPDPYPWTLAKQIYQRMEEGFTTLFYNIRFGHREDFQVSTIGFSEDGSILGDLFSRNEHIITIEKNSSQIEAVYLGGKTFDSFNGRDWTVSATLPEGAFDVIETLTATRDAKVEYLYDYLRLCKVTLRYESFNTSTLFVPGKNTEIKISDAKTEYFQEGNNYQFIKKKGYGTVYELSFYQMNLRNEAFREFVNTPHATDKTLWDNVVRSFEMDRELYTYDAFLNYRKAVYDTYLQPVEADEQVQKWLREAIGDAETPYDKLLAIEADLQKLTYTTRVGLLPEEIQSPGAFLHYLLLDSKKGYCSYYASAFVLLARMEGIPARFVQGFCVPEFGSSKTQVRSDMAHAWPEAYIEGIGWIPFEPTPGYDRMRYLCWNTSEQNRIRNEELAQQRKEALDGRDPFHSFYDHPQEPQEQEQNKTGESLRKLGRVTIYMLLILLGLMLLLLFADFVIMRRRKKSWSAEKFYRYEVKRCLLILSMMGWEREESQTLQEFGEDVKKEFPFLCRDFFLEEYEHYLYGSFMPDFKTVEKVRNRQSDLLEVIKEQRKQNYFLCCMKLYLARFSGIQ